MEEGGLIGEGAEVGEEGRDGLDLGADLVGRAEVAEGRGAVYSVGQEGVEFIVAEDF